jgi:hypothetical protein
VRGHRIRIGAGDADDYSMAIFSALTKADVDEKVSFYYIPGAGGRGVLNIASRVANEAPLPISVADREQLIRRVTLDIFGEPPSAQEIAAFVSDNSPDALAKLTARLEAKKETTPTVGMLSAHQLTFTIRAADPATINSPRTATGPGRYTLGDHVQLQINQTTIEKNERTNNATIVFHAPGEDAASPHKPYEIPLPDGSPEYVFAWKRGSNVLWLSQKGIVRVYDFTNPADVQSTRLRHGMVTDPER